MARSNNDAVLEKFRLMKYTTNASTHNVGDKTSSPIKKFSGAASRACGLVFFSAINSLRIQEKHSRREEVADHSRKSPAP